MRVSLHLNNSIILVVLLYLLNLDHVQGMYQYSPQAPRCDAYDP
jgi:hypothetical protein